MKIDSLQLLRAVAALLVVLNHALFTIKRKAGVDTVDMAQAAALGKLGVELFFMISGYIMVISTRDRSAPGAQPLAFFWRRCIRVVPLYWLATLIYALKLAVSGEPPSLAAMFKSLLFIPYENAKGYWHPVYGLGWTLNYEMLFYALFALALTQKLARGVAGLLLLMGAAVGAGLWLNPAPGSGHEQLLAFWCAPILLCFCAGMALGWWRLALGQRVWRLRFQVQAALALGFILAYCFGIQQWQGAQLFSPLAALGAMGVCGLAAEPPSGAGRASSLRRGVVLLGGASYSLYLTHSFVLGPAGRAWGLAAWHGGTAAFLALTLVLTVLLALAVYRWLEQPLQAFLLRRLPAPAALPAQPG
ncbi:acyltransferase [Massilia sp. NR 4-1]|uniref:acyltransferase family protein n=1 Tax=Massilia sp. NR 4-1 TaxID=1678028 RepID=UPI00067C80C7|nr:acyltransferase [Massilia sp. NR 4-1]AKU23816.1 hypothetical protein ACZ75_22505 [Massilia sp. NR 4-1]